MTLDSAIAAAERTEDARRLIERAQTELVDLVTVSALELCVLDGPRQPVFEEPIARAWSHVTDRRRRKVTGDITAALVRRGLLIDNRLGQGDPTYSLKPELGLMLAARSRPTFVVIAKGERDDLRPLSLFALGDEIDPVRAIVAEMPAEAPPDRTAGHPDTRKLGPLGWINRYVLASSADAADLLARWTITQPAQPGDGAPVRYLVSAYRPDREKPVERDLGVCGDGSRAFVDKPGVGTSELARAEYDLEGLRTVMRHLLGEVSR